MVILETLAIAGMASPLNPSVKICAKSYSVLILLVACLSKLFFKSLKSMPIPLSVTFISFKPLSSISISIFVAPASIAFSMISFNALAGLVTTSPAAIILLIRSSNLTIILSLL